MTRALKWWMALGLVLVFLAGAATGFFGGAWHAQRAFSDRHRGLVGERMREHLKHRLDLTPEQLREVDPILRETSQRLQAIRQETGERVSQAMEESHRELAPHLTPGQLAQLERLKQRHLRRLHHRGGHRHGP